MENNLLEKLITNALAFYLNQGDITISDKEYDQLLKEAKASNKDFNIFKEIGLKDRETIKHLIKFPPLNKYQVDTISSDKWKNDKFLLSLVEKGYKYEPKFSGSGLAIYYDNEGNLRDIISKSNDIDGKRKILSLGNLVPKKVSPGIKSITAELIVDLKHGFKGKSEAQANGLMNSVNMSDKVQELATIVAWDIIPKEGVGNKLDLWNSLYELETDTFKVSPFEDFTLDKLELSREYKCKSFESLIDGLVIYDSNHNAVIALKYYFSSYKDTEVKFIEWNLSDKLALIPKIILNPITLEGINIRQAASNGIMNIMNKGINKGAIVRVARVNSSSPQIVRVVQKVPWTYPKCPYCSEQLDGSTIIKSKLHCKNPLCKSKTKYYERYFSKTNVTKEDIIARPDSYTINRFMLDGYNIKTKRKIHWNDESKLKLAEAYINKDEESIIKLVRDHFYLDDDQLRKVKVFLPAIIHVVNNLLIK